MIRARRPMPVTIDESATLNMGHQPTSMKSTTEPRKTRSTRLPNAPPSWSPIASLSIGLGRAWER